MAVAVTALVAACSVSLACSSTSNQLTADASTTTGPAATVQPAEAAPGPPTVPEAAASAATETPSSDAPNSDAPTTPAGNTVVVIKVVDGDTVDIAGGVRVRVIGIDTPERGSCGADEATESLRSLIGARRVTLVPGARNDTDRYGRLLRYLDVDGVDVGLQQIRSGHATARYDSRDGYGRHAREDEYIAAAASSRRPCGLGGTAQTTIPAAPAAAPTPVPTPAPAPAAAPPAPAGGGTDQRFGTCAAAIAAGFGPYRQGVDPEYGWYRDADHDGTVCEG